MESTIRKYEKSETSELQSLLKNYDEKLEKNEVLLEKFGNFLENEDYQVIKNEILDQEIDIHLIRMELNKRLWKSK